jgi:hypothetical protein
MIPSTMPASASASRRAALSYALSMNTAASSPCTRPSAARVVVAVGAVLDRDRVRPVDYEKAHAIVVAGGIGGDQVEAPETAVTDVARAGRDGPALGAEPTGDLRGIGRIAGPIAVTLVFVPHAALFVDQGAC